ncbi:hypothetical protein HA466_0291670 [Hirschfeldia incana]|nr:hypothetical protein HA466_0291670 [Hirschfeldia incana]
MGTGCCFPNGIPACRRPFRRPSLRERRLRRLMRLAELRKGSQVSSEIKSDKSLDGIDQDQTTLVSGIDIQVSFYDQVQRCPKLF